MTAKKKSEDLVAKLTVGAVSQMVADIKAAANKAAAVEDRLGSFEAATNENLNQQALRIGSLSTDEEKIQLLKKKLESLSESVSGLAGRLENPEWDLNAIRGDCKAVEVQAADHGEQLGQLWTALRTVKESLAALEKSVGEHTSELDGVSTRISEAKNAVNDLKDTREEFKSEIEEKLKAASDKAETDLSKINGKLESFRDSLAYHRWAMAVFAILFLVAVFVVFHNAEALQKYLGS
ncbi:MAG: hypothetical protein U0872_15430 [Planctomycetaceae bacterium]